MSERDEDEAERSDSAPRRGEARGDSADAPRTVAQALARARAHGRAAMAEALLGLRAVLDAAALAATGEPSEAHPPLARLARAAEELAASLREEAGAPSTLVAAIAEALDAEIARWEERAADDPDARAVLRAYLGLREMLWEIGVRRPRRGGAAAEAAESPSEAETARPRRPRRGPRRRLERVPLQG
ncbi:MAG TPA: hypothetical protein VMW35_20165 [Myxococcota bacterium]|nr:hypothetical protein [Myxococcota bacterium]